MAVRLVNPKKKRFTGNRMVNRDRIVEEACVMFAEKGYNGVTIEAIADNLRISKSTIYRHFSGKEEILFEIHNTTHKSLLEGLQRVVESEDSCENKLRQAIATHVRNVLSIRAPTTGAILQEYVLNSSLKHSTRLALRACVM